MAATSTLVGSGTTTNPTLLIQDSTPTTRLSFLDNGVLSHSPAVVAATATMHTLGGGVTASSGTSQTFISLLVSPAYNLTGAFTGTAIGIDYNPTVTSITGAVQLAFRATSGSVLIGNFSTLTGSELLLIRKDVNNMSYMVINNNTAGTAASSEIWLSPNAGTARLRALSSSFTSSGINAAGSMVVSGNNLKVNIGTITAHAFAIWTTNIQRCIFDSNGNVSFSQSSQSTTNTLLTITQAAHTGGNPIGIAYTGGAHTTLAAGVSCYDIFINLSRTIQQNTGNVPVQNAIYVTPPTYSFVGASVINDASTLTISGAPIAGSNATITGRWAAVFSNDVFVSGGLFVSVNDLDSPKSDLDVAGSVGFKIETITAAITYLDASNHSMLADAAGANMTVNVAAGGGTRRIYRIKKIDSSSNTVTIVPNGTETIDGAASVVLSAQYQGITIQSNGSNWFVIARV